MSDIVVRVRGIYATAVSGLLRAADVAVVDPSPAVADRIGGDVPTALPTVAVESADDRLGVGITGDSGAVDRVASLVGGLSADTFRWTSDLPRGAVRAGRVTRTEESGAIVAIGDVTGFLPYSQSDDFVTEGDRLGVQVIDSEPPWSVNRRPVLSTRAHVPGTYLDLVCDPDRPPIVAPDRELHGIVDLLEPSLPGDWSAVVGGTATAVSMDVLDEELTRLRDRREAVEQAMGTAADPDEPGGIYVPETTVWCRIGREGRFALDENRAALTQTIEGHHRLKAGGEDAGRAVDYLERLAVEVPFDAAAVLDSFGPGVGDRVRIYHGKPTGETIVLGRGEVVSRPQPDAITVRRELSAGGRLDALDVPKEAGDAAETTFVEGRQWAPTVYRNADGERKGTYVNVATPVELLPNRVAYVDLYIDVIRNADGTVATVDEDELDSAVEDGILTDDLASAARRTAGSIERSLKQDE